MRSSEPIPFSIGDRVRLKKPHPCGNHDWTVVRLGADIGLTCDACGRRILLPRRELERRMKAFIFRVDEEAKVDAGATAVIDAQHVESLIP